MRAERRPSPKTVLAGQVWRDMFDFFINTRKERDPMIAKHALTANDAKGLWSLSTSGGKTMGALAAEWTCDASNATWIVDRLEKRGLAERRSAPADRRVKMVFLTPAGKRIRDSVMEAFYQPPEALLDLPRTDLEVLRDVIGHLTAIAREQEARGAAREPASERPA